MGAGESCSREDSGTYWADAHLSHPGQLDPRLRGTLASLEPERRSLLTSYNVAG